MINFFDMRKGWVKGVIPIIIGILGLILGVTSSGGCSPHGTTAPPAPLAEMPTGLSQKIDAAGAALVPDIRETAPSSLSLPAQAAALTYGTASQWIPFTQAGTLLTDVFGPAEDGKGVVTRIRVVLYYFGIVLQDILNADSDFSCDVAANGTRSFNGGDTVEIASYGAIPNGAEGDRYFDCVREETSSDADESWTLATLYGLSSGGRVNVVYMQDIVGTGGTITQSRNRTVVWTTYQEEVQGDTTVANLDIQFNMLGNSQGADGTLNTADDPPMKVRTRITGRVAFDASYNADDAVGDFSVTHFRTNGAERETSKNLGRGGYATGDDFLFRIDTDGYEELDALGGFFCLEATDPNGGGVPVYIDGANCAGFEPTFAWGNVEFFTDLVPPLTQVFEDRLFFEEADLISDDGSNFAIPNYD